MTGPTLIFPDGRSYPLEDGVIRFDTGRGSPQTMEMIEVMLLVGQVGELREAYIQLSKLQDQQKSQSFALANDRFGEAIAGLLSIATDEVDEVDDGAEDG